jgi:hypothetical protein
MALFDDVFNASVIYDTLFFNVKAILIHPTLKDLEEKNKSLYERWQYLSKIKYNVDFDVIHTDAKGSVMGKYTEKGYLQKVYEDNAPYYPEYCRIVAITYGKVFLENGKLKRSIKKIANEDEKTVIEMFMSELYQISSDGVKSSPPVFPAFCGYNIISYDIPMLIKRFIVHKNKFENKTLPFVLKRALNIKPWESGLIDVVNVWKFNGFDNIPLMLIADHMELKKTADLLPLPELSKYYWENVNKNGEETLEHIALQSATQTNFVIQLMYELRQL